MQAIDALERLGEMPSVLREALKGASEAQVRRRAADGTFCLLEQACHLRDLEREGYAVRLRRMLEEDQPALAGFDGDAVARERDYMAQDAHQALREFTAARRAFVDSARRLDAHAMSRTATFMGRTITVGDLLAMMVEHDDGHRAEIEALAWK